jgi:hypothetical protein
MKEVEIKQLKEEKERFESELQQQFQRVVQENVNDRLKSERMQNLAQVNRISGTLYQKLFEVQAALGELVPQGKNKEKLEIAKLKLDDVVRALRKDGNELSGALSSSKSATLPLQWRQ